MAGYTYNDDKRCEATGNSSLYNNVLSVTLGAGTEPVTLDEGKLWGKIDQSDEDDLITALLKAARMICEKFTGIGFMSRQVVGTIDNANGNFKLPYGPITDDPTGVDVNGNTLTVVTNSGQVISPCGRMTVTYTGGWATLPDDLKTALKQQFLFMYENRGESAVVLSPMARMILEPLREVV